VNLLQFVDRLNDEIDAAVEKESVDLANDRAKDHADYRHRTGTIRGLKDAKDLAVDLVRTLLKDDDDDGSQSG
jgi:hypothetical protein